jgi:hypothetical protein
MYMHVTRLGGSDGLINFSIEKWILIAYVVIPKSGTLVMSDGMSMSSEA